MIRWKENRVTEPGCTMEIVRLAGEGEQMDRNERTTGSWTNRAGLAHAGDDNGRAEGDRGLTDTGGDQRQWEQLGRLADEVTTSWDRCKPVEEEFDYRGGRDGRI